MTHSANQVVRRLRRAALGSDGGGQSDGQLLRGFLARHDQWAFESLVRRHGPMVLGVCRRVLRNGHDAEDAFQATFLVLVRKAASLALREILGDWLHGVANRTALKARAAQARRRVKERQMPKREAVVEPAASDWKGLLDQELSGLPEKYRVPVILCELEGRTHQQAARQIGCPVGTLSGRLSRARALLARRLKRRGLSLSAGAIAGTLCPNATASEVSNVLLDSTVRAATLVAAGQAAAGIVSAKVTTLTEGVLKAMLFTKLKALGAVLVVAALVGIGSGALRPAAAEEPDPTPVVPPHSATTAAPPIRTSRVSARRFQIAFKMFEEKDGKLKRLGDPKIVTLGGKEVGFAEGGEVAVRVNDAIRFVTTGITVRTAVSADELGRIELDLTVSRTSPLTIKVENGGVFASESLRVIQGISLGKPVSVELEAKDKARGKVRVDATVTEMPIEKTLESAERDFRAAEFYRRSGRDGSALFYYELVCRRYPETLYATQAKERIETLNARKKLADPALEKKPARAGEILVIGNTKTPVETILEHLELWPGAGINPDVLKEAAERLAKHVKLKKPPRITVVDPDSGSEFKQIRVELEEE